MFKGNDEGILSDALCKEENALFTTLTFKPLSEEHCGRYHRLSRLTL